MRGFIEELRHRNRFRVAIAYTVAGVQFNHVTSIALVIAVAWLRWDDLQRPTVESIPESAVEPTVKVHAVTSNNSIAVLPLVNTSSHEDVIAIQEDIAAGIATAIDP